MRFITAFCLTALLCYAVTESFGQSVDSVGNRLTQFPMRLFGHVQSKAAALSGRLERQTQKYVQRLQREEERLERKLYAIDPSGAKYLFTGSNAQYAAFDRRLQNDPGTNHQQLSGVYQPHVDSLQTALAFLKGSPQLLRPMATTSDIHAADAGSVSPERLAQINTASAQLQAIQAKLQDAGRIKGYMQERKQAIAQYIASHADLQPALAKPFAGMQRTMYYYSAQVNEYRSMLNSPDKLEQQALGMLSILPAFASYMSVHSQLGSLFSLPGGGSATRALAGLQTRSQISEAATSHLKDAAAGGSSNQSSNSAAATAPGAVASQLALYKSKLSQLGAGSSDIDAPNFRPNDQKAKLFLHRLQYGVDLQTSQTTYYFPTTTSFGVSLGYCKSSAKSVLLM